MHLTRRMLSIAGVPLLGGCMMMGGLGHTGDPGWMDDGHMVSGHQDASVQRAEASSNGHTIALFVPAPSPGATVPIDARLLAERAEDTLSDGDVSLRIATPDGRVDHVRMERGPASAPGTFQAWYHFPSTGVYLMTADGLPGAAADAPTVSVTARVVVQSGMAHGGRRDWLLPAAILSGVGWVAMMVVMVATH